MIHTTKPLDAHEQIAIQARIKIVCYKNILPHPGCTKKIDTWMPSTKLEHL